MAQNQAFPVHLRAKEAARFLAVSKSTFWRWVSIGRITKGIRLSARCTVWPKEALDAFLERQAAEEVRA